jgi:hypothetical protein
VKRFRGIKLKEYIAFTQTEKIEPQEIKSLLSFKPKPNLFSQPDQI